jgi:aryl-alcohol dehydrogenase-like predicted oxidoreductase
MQYRMLGQTGLLVSRLGFGAATFTQGNRSIRALYKVGAELAAELVAAAIDAGVTLFDTADVYADGESETLLGAALKPHRNSIVLTSKVGNRGSTDKDPLHGGLSARHIHASIDASLKRLGTDWIDFYVCHREDPYTPLEVTLRALDDVVRAGKVRYLGFSNWSAWNVAAAMELQRANGWAPFTHGQMYYSLLGRDVERDVIPMMQRYGLGMTVWGPLASGFLSGAYSRADLDDPDNRFHSFDMLGFDRDKGFGLIDIMRRIAQEKSVSVAQLAIAWLLAKPGVTSVLLGATKIGQLQDTLAAASIRLTDAEVGELDTATAIPTIYATSQWVTPDYRAAKALRS